MSYSMLKNSGGKRTYTENGLEYFALKFIRESCQKLRFNNKLAEVYDDAFKEEYSESQTYKYTGTSLGRNQIPYNMQKDIDRLCLENAVERFLKSGRKEDAFDVYFCYLEMFAGEYGTVSRMIELLSEFEANSGSLLMKHRDHYSHSVYVFALGLAVYESNTVFRDTYKKYYRLEDEHKAACHYLQYWGLASLFHDVGYPFELPFEQVASYFETDGSRREEHPFVAYKALDKLIIIDGPVKNRLADIFRGRNFTTVNELFAYSLADKFGGAYGCDEKEMLECLENKPAQPDKFNYFMDHAYFSAAVLFQKLFEKMGCSLRAEHIDALTAVLMHNSLYKFCIANPNKKAGEPKKHLSYKEEGNIALKAELHPLAYMLMMCDELQCWDRTAYGRNSKKELHPMSCRFDFSDNAVKAVYLFDEKEAAKIDGFKDKYIEWLSDREKEVPALKAYSGLYIKNGAGVSGFQEDIERIVDLTEIKLNVETGLCANIRTDRRNYLSGSNFINLYRFAAVLNGRWSCCESWKNAKKSGQENRFISDKLMQKSFMEAFEELSLEYKLSNINQAKAFAKYMNEIGCFYTDRAVDFELLEKFTKEELLKIGPLEHQRWLQEHLDMGWIYGTPDKSDRELCRQHKDMLPDNNGGEADVPFERAERNYQRLNQAEQDKDTEPMECMLAMMKMFDGVRIYRL